MSYHALYISEARLSEHNAQGLFCLVCNSPVQGQVMTRNVLSVVLDVELDNPRPSHS